MKFPRFSRRAWRTRAAAGLVCVASALPSGASTQTAPDPLDPAVNPGDVVRLEVWREEDMSGEFLVDQRGLVTLPLVGEVDTRGQTELSLRTLVRERMNESIWNPSIQLFVLKRVRVLGEVLEPGVFHLDPTMSVADALAMAGGRTPLARDGVVLLRRADTSLEADVQTSALLSELAVETGDELLVPRQPWLRRNIGTVVTGATGVLTAVVIYLVNK